ncbi:AEC family transporter [Shewanella surugensis]|uniref:AEC family transporter n=1 Tax=Shewanella surugensis TaxID=212020 RepID=A0ABT0LE29_9GAMM|nr:AEC family transporter [Shewanella surugensis]MCL1125958.1 AEC family transporter [Shewanella surugensis]
MLLFQNVIQVITPVLLAASAGYLFAKCKQPLDIKMIAKLMANIGYPALILAHMLGQDVELNKLLQMILAAFLMFVLFALFVYLFLRIAKQSLPTYFSCLSMNNVGNIGLAICALAFGHDGILYGVTFVIIGMIFMFIVTPGVTSGKWSLKEVLISPAIYTVILALCILAFQIHLPKPVISALQILGGMPIPLMLITLGYSLAQIKFSNIKMGIIFSLVHLVIGALIAVILSQLLGFSGNMRGILIIQCMMPTAINTYLWISIYRPQDAAQISGIIFISTLLSIFTLPLVLTYWI